ncbi:MAG: SDR family NAD(P)-dependent oxidoreductase [Salinirussus sp.]
MTDALSDDRAVVTGAARGIGRAITERYAAEGASVALLDIDAEGAEAVAAYLETESLAIECDVSDTASVESAIDTVVDAFGGIDILVNNAGVIHRSPLVESTDEQLDRVIDVNLKGVLKMTRAATPHLRRSEGCIVNLSSVASVEGTDNRNVYSATKGGVSALTYQQSLELAPDVRVNALAPGTIESPMTADDREDTDYVEGRLAKVPRNRLGQPEDVAGAAVFLASADADYVNGHVLHVDGGRYHT